MSYKRLRKLASFVNFEDKVLDVGADHCIVPYFLIKDGKTRDITVAELSENALNNGKRFLQSKNIDFVKFYHSNGFGELEDPNYFDSIILAGFGGKNISEVLLSTYGLKHPKLILNPTNNEVELRKTLRKLNYKIIHEELLVENGIIHLIMTAKHFSWLKKKNKNENLYIGPKIKKQRNRVTYTYFKNRMDRLEKIISQRKDDKHYIEFITIKKWLSEFR